MWAGRFNLIDLGPATIGRASRVGSGTAQGDVVEWRLGLNNHTEQRACTDSDGSLRACLHTVGGRRGCHADLELHLVNACREVVDQEVESVR